MKHLDVTELIDRNVPALRGKKVIAGYPKRNGKRMYYNVHNCIMWREYATRYNMRMNAIFAKYTPEEILAKMRAKT
jgi:hypothetical protein